ncbi:MAG: hypothetical protein FWG05_02705, partial [Kiritimatiellaeota bacterium]|nr:hypothetical protein [Kiritimatiellota bacterium]
MFCGETRAQAQSRDDTADVSAEIAYINNLDALQMPEYAEMALQRALIRWPQHKEIFNRKKIEFLLQQGKFDGALKIIEEKDARDPDSVDVWTMRLTVDDYYFAHGKYETATNNFYKAMFAKYDKAPPESGEMLDLYANSLYKFSQMLMMLGQEKPALALLEKLAKVPNIPRIMKRQVVFEVSELMLRIAKKIPDDKAHDKERGEWLEKAKRATEDVLWSVDLWFGRGVVQLAHIYQLQGKTEEAEKLIRQYTPQLNDIHKQLVKQSEEDGVDYTRLSPMAECRFLLGMMKQETAEKMVADGVIDKASGKLLESALQDFVNVYARFPSSTWA